MTGANTGTGPSSNITAGDTEDSEAAGAAAQEPDKGEPDTAPEAAQEAEALQQQYRKHGLQSCKQWEALHPCP